MRMDWEPRGMEARTANFENWSKMTSAAAARK